MHPVRISTNPCRWQCFDRSPKTSYFRDFKQTPPAMSVFSARLLEQQDKCECTRRWSHTYFEILPLGRAQNLTLSRSFRILSIIELQPHGTPTRARLPLIEAMLKGCVLRDLARAGTLHFRFSASTLTVTVVGWCYIVPCFS